MKGYKNKLLIVATALMMIFLVVAPAFADQVTVTGKVTEDYQIVDSQGQSYDLAEGAIAEELVSQASGKTVEITGTLEEDGDMKTIMVESYKILQE